MTGVVPVRLQRLLQLRRGLPRRRSRLRRLRGHDHHPQHWPEELDYRARRIVVIGSGATAVTLIPALADSGAGQRDHVAALADLHRFAARRRPVHGADEQAVAREVGVRGQPVEVDRFPVRAVPDVPALPEADAQDADAMAKRRLPEGYDVEKHFGPNYNPWDERLCLAPNGDLFKTIREQVRPTSSPTPSSGSPRPGSS